MIVQALGKADVNFTNKDGSQIKGTTLYIAFPSENCEGLQTEKIFLKESIKLPEDFRLNSKIDIAFDIRGKVQAISKA